MLITPSTTTCLAFTAFVTLAAYSPTAPAATFNGSGLVQDAGNWTGGLPTTAGNVGIIGAGDSGEVGNTTALATEVSVNGLFIDQQGGNIFSTSFRGSEFVSTVWTISGGAMNTLGQNWKSGSSLTLNGGGAINVDSGRDFFLSNGSAFTMDGGTMSVGDQFSSAGTGGTFNLNAGTLTVGNFGTGFNSSGTYNFNGSSLTAGSYGSFQKVSARTINFGTAAGAVEITGNFDAFNTTIDWTAGSSYTLTISGSLLDTGVATTYETLYTEGQILFEGANTDPFASVFSVSGNTLSLIPEPASLALMGLGGLLMLGRGRRSA